MKRYAIFILTLTMILSMSACDGPLMLNIGSQNECPTIAVDQEPVVVPDVNSIYTEYVTCYFNGKETIAGLRFTHGTNCGNDGLILFEYLREDGTVLHTFSPKFAGGTLDITLRGDSYPDATIEVTETGFDRVLDKETIKKQRLDPRYSEALYQNTYVIFRGMDFYCHIETLAGRTTFCNLYNQDGEMIASIKPFDPYKELSVAYRDDGIAIDEYDYTQHKTTRKLYYSYTGKRLAELIPTSTSCQAKNASGELIKTFLPLAESYNLIVDYFPFYDMLHVYHSPADDSPIYENCYAIIEYYDLSTGTLLCQADYLYYDDFLLSEEVPRTFFDGKLVATPTQEDPTKYLKIDFYDTNGALRRTVNAEPGEYLIFSFDEWRRAISIHRYDSQGNCTVCFYGSDYEMVQY